MVKKYLSKISDIGTERGCCYIENEVYNQICNDLHIYHNKGYDSLPEFVAKKFVSCIIIESKRNKNNINACLNIKNTVSYLGLTEDKQWREIVDGNLPQWIDIAYKLIKLEDMKNLTVGAFTDSDIDKIFENAKKKGTRKISDFPEEKICRHREHNPAGMVVREPGNYEHTCPGCGNIQNFTVPPKPTM